MGDSPYDIVWICLVCLPTSMVDLVDLHGQKIYHTLILKEVAS